MLSAIFLILAAVAYIFVAIPYLRRLNRTSGATTNNRGRAFPGVAPQNLRPNSGPGSSPSSPGSSLSGRGSSFSGRGSSLSGRGSSFSNPGSSRLGPTSSNSGSGSGANFSSGFSTGYGTGSRSAADSDRAREKAAIKKEFATLFALTDELNLTNFSLRNSIIKTAGLVVEQLDFDTISLLEARLFQKLSPVDSANANAINEAACQLERTLASCQTVCAMIDVGPREASDQSRDDANFVSLLGRARKRLSRIPGRMKDEKRIVADAAGDLVRAQQWMETASLVVRSIPLKTRFANLKSIR